MPSKKVTIVTITLILLLSWWMHEELSPLYDEMQALKKPRYELGEHKGAEFCANCHQEIYDQWAKSSRHVTATTTQSFHDYKDKFTNNFLLNAVMGEDMCYACHGSKKVNKGVDCEACHGIANSNVPIMETHAKKFKPDREKLKKSKFCGDCHEIKNPLSGDFIISTYHDWQTSEAAENGMTCQACHMKPRKGKTSYHGFDAMIRNPEIYNGDISINDVKLQFPNLNLVIENHILGHGIPPVGPSRVLGLEIIFKDHKGNEFHKTIHTFSKKFSLMPIAGIMPYKLIKDTQLRSGEKRSLSYNLPAELLKENIAGVELSLRFYDVSDEHQGDIAKAHWVSSPILTKEVTF